MKNIKILSSLDIVDGNLVTKGTKYNEVFLKQGTIDGACGPYCLFMALIILGVVKSKEVYDSSNTDRRKKFGKLIAQLNQFEQFFTNGTDIDDLEKMINESYPKDLVVEKCDKKDDDLIDFIINELEGGFPVLVRISGSNLEHWMVAVGFEKINNSRLKKLMFLCPSSEAPINYWNATIKINKQSKKYPHNWIDYLRGESKNVQLKEAISFG